MSRPSDSCQRTHQLKLLREIVGLSQPEFAQLTGISVDVVRSLEIARRNQGRLSGEILEQILLILGAEWDEESVRWLFVWNKGSDPVVPYTREHFETFRAELLSEANDRSMVVYYLLYDFLRFLEAIPAKSFNGWFWKLDWMLDRWAKEFGLKRTPYQLDPHWDRKAARVLGYRKMFPSLLRGEEKKFGELIDRARQEQKKQLARSEAEGQEQFESEQEQHGADTTTRKQKKAPRSPRPPAAE